jgi:hypothetical protein
MKSLGVSAVRNDVSFSMLTGVNNPYNDALRVVRKVFEKQRQLAPRAPNIVCLGLSDRFPDVISVQWAAEDVFSGTPRRAQSMKRHLEEILINNRTMSGDEAQIAKEEIQRLEKWMKKFTTVSQLTGLLVFRWENDRFLPEKTFRNPSPFPESSLLDAEWKAILKMLGFRSASSS